MSLAWILEAALKLFELPRNIGEFEGKTVTIGVGRFGPYIRHNSKFTSLKKTDDPLSITLERAIELHSNGVVLEFETLIEMTQHPDIGVELVKHMNEICENFYANHGLKSEIRLTPNDLREFERPPKATHH
ncbi:MAG: hypothetical protein HC831_14930 [Chloroflexia bacterium]|nr:hypothetical protein [Chloroflexia bacterium]